MSFDFPSSPSEGQVFAAPGGPTYVFNTPVWKAVGQGQIAIISDTPPSNPANGALWYESDSGILYIWYNDGNSSQWVQVGGIAAGASVIQTIITSSGTYTKPAGLRFLEIEVQGAGGGGGGASATSATLASAGSGGGSGGYSRSTYPAASIPATVSMTIGAGGTSAGSSHGGAGGATSFGSLGTGPGGGGGFTTSAVSAPTYIAQGAAGAVGTNGQLNLPGQGGTFGYAMFWTGGGPNIGGGGGNSMLGHGGQHIIAGVGMGAAPTGYGAGGNGYITAGVTGAQAGSPGTVGVIILKEYF